MTWPMGAGSRGMQLPKFGLRLGQARMGGNNGNPLAVGDPMRHRELLRLEVSSRQDAPALDMHALDMRVRFAGRVTYDINHGMFGLQTDTRPLPALAALKRPSPPSASAAGDRSDRLGKPKAVLIK